MRGIRNGLWAVLALSVWGGPALAVTPKRGKTPLRRPPTVQPAPKPTVVQVRPEPPRPDDMSPSTKRGSGAFSSALIGVNQPSRYQLNVGLGSPWLSKAGFASGVFGQLGYRLYLEHPIFIGPEVDFALFHEGSTLSTLFGGWYSGNFSTNSHQAFSFGIALGPTFCAQIPQLNSVVPTIFAEAVVAHEINELAAVRVVVRGGTIGKGTMLMTFLSVQFRFL